MIMKKIFYFSLLFFSLAVFAQHQKTVYRFLPTIKETTIYPIAFKYNFSQKKIFLNGNNLNIHNSINNLNFNYYSNWNSVHLDFPNSFPYNNFDNTKIDVYNPYGASNIGDAFIFGAFNFLFSDR